jgi:polyisoprenyl-phosphate glycosyltransferase
MKKIDLSIVMPCYNEEKNIPLILERFRKILAGAKNAPQVELILVDNNSKDNSAQVLRKILSQKKYSFARTVFEKSPGYGIAVFSGLRKAKGEYLCWTHGDIQTDPKDTLTAYEIIQKQSNPKMSYIKGKRHGRPLFDVFFTMGMSFFESLLFMKGFWEINAQPNLFYKSFMTKMKSPPSDFSLDLYTYYMAKKNNYDIVRFPVYFGKRLHGVSSWNTSLGAKWKFIKRTVKFSLNLKKKV